MLLLISYEYCIVVMFFILVVEMTDAIQAGSDVQLTFGVSASVLSQYAVFKKKDNSSTITQAMRDRTHNQSLITHWNYIEERKKHTYTHRHSYSILYQKQNRTHPHWQRCAEEGTSMRSTYDHIKTTMTLQKWCIRM